MSRTKELMDQVMDIGQRELEHLAAEEVEEAEQLARRRAELLTRAMELWGTEDIAEQRACLDRFKELNDLIRAEARRLHEHLRERLKRTKQETKRFGAYGMTVRGVPRIRNKYLNRVG